MPEAGDSYRELVERISNSRGFRRSARLRAFLSYVCDRAHAGREDEIHEQFIGHRVFGRDEDYDPASDNIVRVEAREVRKRLAAYFSGEGAEEPVVLRIPKGGYVPVFEPRAVKETEPTPESADSVVRTGPPPVMIYVSLAVSTVLFLAAAWFYGEAQEAKIAAPADASPTRAGAFWGRMFSEDRPTLIALADSNFALLQDLRRESVPIQDYFSGRYFGSLASGESSPGQLDRIYSTIATRHYTSLADVNTVARFLTMNSARSAVTIRYARGLEIRDLKSHNSIILGSERSTPVASVFSDVRRFRIEYDSDSGNALIRDKNPGKGQPSTYTAGTGAVEPYDAYGVVCSLPNLDNSGHVLLIAGTNMQATEAAGEFVSNLESFEQWLEHIGWKADQELPIFEVLLKLTTVGDSSFSTEVIASRSGAGSPGS